MHSLLKNHPFKVLATVTLILYLPSNISMYHLSGESDGAFGLVKASVPVWGVIYWLPDQLLLALDDGKRFMGQLPLSVAIGVLACILGDRILYWLRKRRVSEHTHDDAPRPGSGIRERHDVAH